MSTAVVTAVTAIVAALGLAGALGVAHNRRSGRLQDSRADPGVDTAGLGLSPDTPTIVHFTATWCGPCAAVRRVVDQVCAELPDVAHVEIDIDANPEVARRFSVLSLPTTFIFDADGRQRYRSSGVPKAADLRAAVQALLA